MQVRLLVSLSGTRDGEDWPPAGAVVDLSDETAVHMLAGGLAEPVGAAAPESAAAAVTTETAAATVRPTRRTRKG